MEIEVSPTRFAKAVSLVLNSAITRPSSRPIFLVQGSDPTLDPYVVWATSDMGTCSCPWGQHAPTDWSNSCSHALAAASFGEVPIPPIVVPVST